VEMTLVCSCGVMIVPSASCRQKSEVIPSCLVVVQVEFPAGTNGTKRIIRYYLVYLLMGNITSPGRNVKLLPKNLKNVDGI